MRMNRIIALVAGLMLCAGIAHADFMLDFNGLSHGDIVNTQFEASHGVTISAKSIANYGPNRDLAVAFDSGLSGTRDPDLQGPPSHVWDGGNLSPTEDLGILLILQEHDDPIPDDEGDRPAGSIYLDYSSPILSLGFDLVDVEGPCEYGGDNGYFAVFYSEAGAELARVGFDEFISRDGVVYGNNTANRIQPLTVAELGVDSFRRVEINFGGSAAVDNINWTAIPEPATLGLMLLAVAAAGVKARKRKSL